jgi:hypothetical protein
MTIPPNPPQLEQLGPRPFSFYPPILNVEHNEWLFRRATWAEILIVNTRSQQEVWIPRRYLGEISRIDEPVMIVGLIKELEYKAGQVWPHERRILEMPIAVNAPPVSPTPVPPPPHRPILDGSAAESRVGLMIGAALLVSLMVTLLGIYFWGGNRIRYTAVLQQDLGFSAQDDYHSVVRKLGPPASDHWRSATGERQYRALGYPKLRLTVILMGVERDQAVYVGALNEEWKPVHTVKLPNRTDTRRLLESIPRF